MVFKKIEINNIKMNRMEENLDKEKLREIAESLNELLPPIIEKVKDYAALANRTPEEEKEFGELIALIAQSLPVLETLKDYFGTEIYKQATAFYYRVKEKAANGDRPSREIVDELAPLYQQAIIDQLSKN